MRARRKTHGCSARGRRTNGKTVGRHHVQRVASLQAVVAQLENRPPSTARMPTSSSPAWSSRARQAADGVAAPRHLPHASVVRSVRNWPGEAEAVAAAAAWAGTASATATAPSSSGETRATRRGESEGATRSWRARGSVRQLSDQTFPGSPDGGTAPCRRCGASGTFLCGGRTIAGRPRWPAPGGVKRTTLPASAQRGVARHAAARAMP